MKDVVGCYVEPKPPYTTVASIINNLKRKGYLQAERLGNTYRYTPWWLRKNIPASLWATLCAITLPILIRRWFRSFAKEQKISKEDLNEIINLIEKREDK